MEQTPMQELIEWARTPAKEGESQSIVDKMFELLEKEKKVIIEAYKADRFQYSIKGLGDNAEQYYNETFKK